MEEILDLFFPSDLQLLILEYNFPLHTTLRISELENWEYFSYSKRQWVKWKHSPSKSKIHSQAHTWAFDPFSKHMYVYGCRITQEKNTNSYIFAS